MKNVEIDFIKKKFILQIIHSLLQKQNYFFYQLIELRKSNKFPCNVCMTVFECSTSEPQLTR